MEQNPGWRGEQPSQPPAESKTYWYGLADTLMIGGAALRVPHSYVGASLAAVHDTGGEFEPAVIDPTLEVDLTATEAVFDGETPSYALLRPGQRAFYLRWLGVEPAPSDSPSWAVRLQLFGIERRVLLDHRHANLAGELPGLLVRLQQLRRTQAATEDRELDEALAQLIVVVIGWPGAAKSIAPEPADVISALALPSAAEVFLGWSSQTSSAIPVATLITILRSFAKDEIPPEATQCIDEFDSLFGLRSSQAGLLQPLPAEILRSDEQLQPLSPSFKLPIRVSVDRINGIDDGWWANCLSLAAQCGVELSSFARWTRINPEIDSADARRILMPADLGGSGAEALPDLVSFLDDRCSEAPFADINPAELDSLWPLSDTPTANMLDYLDLIRFLDRAGYGLVPDPRFGDPLLDGTRVAFRTVQQGEPTVGLLVHLDSLRVAWRIIVADGRVTDAEVWRLEDRLDAQQAIEPPDQLRILATHQWHKRRPDHGFDPDSASTLTIRTELLGATAEQRQALGRLLIALACSDAQLASVELDTIRELFMQLGLPLETFDETITLFTPSQQVDTLTSATLPAARPLRGPSARLLAEITMGSKAPASGSNGASVPPTDASLAVSTQQEPFTTPVAGVDTDEVDADNPEPFAMSTPTTDVPAGTALSEPIRELLRGLRGQPVVPVSDARWLARQQGLMWGDASETINDLALDLTGEMAVDEQDQSVLVVDWVVEELLR